MPDEDIHSLVKFLNDMESDLASLVEMQQNFVPVGLDKLFIQSWEQVKSENKKSKNWLLAILDGGTAENIERLNRLRDVGLTGVQLALKLACYYRSRNKWLTEKENSVSSGSMESRPWVKKTLDLLGWINRLLGSFCVAHPGNEIVKEFKELIEGLIGERDWRFRWIW